MIISTYRTIKTIGHIGKKTIKNTKEEIRIVKLVSKSVFKFIYKYTKLIYKFIKSKIKSHK